MEKLEEVVIERGGIDYRVWVETDWSTTPDEFDCYDEADKRAWLQDKWEFVTVYVALADPGTCGECGRDNVAAFDALSAVEYGQIREDKEIDIWSFINDEYMNAYDPVSGESTSETMVESMIGELNARRGRGIER